MFKLLKKAMAEVFTTLKPIPVEENFINTCFGDDPVNVVRFDGCYNYGNYGCRIMYLITSAAGSRNFGDYGGWDSSWSNGFGLLIKEDFTILGLYSGIEFICGTICKTLVRDDLKYHLGTDIVDLLATFEDTREIKSKYKLSMDENKVLHLTELGV